MAALAADSRFMFLGSPTKGVFSSNQAATVPFYAGSLVYIDTAGGVQSVPAAGDYFLGISPKKQTVAVGADVEVFIDGVFLLPLPAANLTVADEGDLLIMNMGTTTTDNPADCESNLDATGASPDICIGRIYRVTTEGMWIKLEPKLCVTNAGWV